MHEIARNLRSAERYLLAPPVSGIFGAVPVAVCDVSRQGARFRHPSPLGNGTKAILRIDAAPPAPPLDLEAVIVWTQPEGEGFVSGVRTYGPAQPVQLLLETLRSTRRAQRIEEMRSTERFAIASPFEGTFGGEVVVVEDLSARGARIALNRQPAVGTVAPLRFVVPGSGIPVEVRGGVRWTAMRSVGSGDALHWRAGLLVEERPEMMRLAIGRLTEDGRAAIDAHSLALKIRILRARARQLAGRTALPADAGIPAEHHLLIQGVREELRVNPEESILWYRRARILIADPATRAVAGPIAGHPDALAVWEYLQRSIDPSIVARAFGLDA